MLYLDGIYIEMFDLIHKAKNQTLPLAKVAAQQCGDGNVLRNLTPCWADTLSDGYLIEGKRKVVIVVMAVVDDEEENDADDEHTNLCILTFNHNQTAMDEPLQY